MPPRPAVRLADVAAASGVSITTVSHVVNGTRFVAPDTRARVERALSDLKYVSPVTSRPEAGASTIGLAITGSSNPYFGELIQGVESELSRSGRALLLCDSHDDPGREAQAVSTLLAHNVDAIIMAPSTRWKTDTLPLLRRHATPFVLVDRLSEARCDQVGVENELASAKLVEHLLDHGHTRVGMIAGLGGLSTTVERVDGFRRAHAASGVPLDEALVVSGHSTTSGGRSAVHQLMNSANPPTAIFSANNAMTIGALLAFRELGRTVPDDLALVVFDDFDWAGAVTPALTAVAQPFHAVGAYAVHLLARRLADPTAPRKVVRLPAEIHHRESCGCS